MDGLDLVTDIMGELLIAEGAVFHTVFADRLRCNEQRTTQMRNFAQSISGLLGGFSGEITGACRRFFKRLKVDESEDESIIFLSKYIIDILNELAKKITAIHKKIDIDVVHPLAALLAAQTNTHANALKRSEQLLDTAQTNFELLRELRRNFELNQNSRGKSEEEKELLKELVEEEIGKCNAKWQELKGEYQSMLSEADSENCLRCNATLRAQITTVRLLNRLVGSDAVEESLQEYEEVFCQNETLSMEVREEMRDKLGKLIIFEGECSSTDYSAPDGEHEQMLIDDFIGFFTSRSNLKEEERNYEAARTLILQDMNWTNYFLGKLRSGLHTEIKLSQVKFRELATILKYIFALVVELPDNQAVLYQLLYISYRVRCKDQYLIRQLGKHQDFWRDISLWERIISHIRQVRGRGREEEQPRRQLRLRKLFSRATWAKQTSRASTQKRIRSERIIQDAKAYETLCQVNYYMAKLQLQEHFIFEFMLSQSTRYHLPQDNTRKLLEYHYMNKMDLTNRLSANYIKRKERLEEQYRTLNKQQKLVIAVGKCLKYLPADAKMANFMLVCKAWQSHLHPRVMKRYLIEERDYGLVNRFRLKLYCQVCRPPFSRTVYKRMVDQVPEFTEHTEIIQLDARRSLGWDQKLRVQMVQILRSFAFYHPDNGYLQGMNYLCENILKLTDDSFLCYAIFEHLMNNQYYGLYTGSFQGLKTKIYQFMRILQRERPELYEHLTAEKVEGQHFLLSWAITLWGEMSGQLSWVLWDGFIVQGWAWWFKTALWLLKVLQPELLKMSFEQIMKCFSDLHSSLFSYSLQELAEYGIDKTTIKEDIDSIRIEREVLIEIEKEYKLKANTINQYLNRNYGRK